eukprot:Em0001g1789a
MVPLPIWSVLHRLMKKKMPSMDQLMSRLTNLPFHISTPLYPNDSSLIQFVAHLWDGTSSLMRACGGGLAEIVRILVSAGAHVNDQKKTNLPFHISTPLYPNDSSLIQFVAHLRGVSSVTIMRNCVNGWSSLMEACRVGHAEVVRILVSAGAHVNDQDKNGWSSLMMACRNGHAEVVRILVSAGAHVNDQDKIVDFYLFRYGDTAMQRSYLDFEPLGVLCLVTSARSKGIDANLVNHRDLTPLKLASGCEVLTILQKYTTSCENFPVHTYGKVMMCEDSGATLTEVLDSILEQGFLLGLAWGQDRNQALQNDPLTTTTTPTGPSEEDILDSELNESSL